MKFREISIGEIITPLEYMLRKLCFFYTSSEDMKDRGGGYFTIRSKDNGRILLVILIQIGEYKQEKAEKYFTLSLEKGLRLFGYQQRGDVSSWQSRDGKDFWGGAIVAGEFILSFSGFPELADEALVLMIATIFKWISNDEAVKIAKISNNKTFFALKS